MSQLCRDCCVIWEGASDRCGTCAGRRVVIHDELKSLSIAHLDCDAFFAAVEKRDNPELRDQPVIVGGGTRGVVSTACYIAREFGIGSAMPMFQARQLCPHAVVLRPDMNRYRAASRQIRSKLIAVTPRVQNISIDEAFLDLSGAHGSKRPNVAAILAKLAREIEDEIGVTVSIGLSYNKLLAKIASDIQKPAGFSVVGRAESREFLTLQPVRILPGVGPVLARSLSRAGLETVGDLANVAPGELTRRYGSIGRRLSAYSRGEDARAVSMERSPKSLSAETTLERDESDAGKLADVLARLVTRVSRRLERARLAGHIVVLKLKTPKFQTLTRSCRTSAPVCSSADILSVARALLHRETNGRAFRLVGVGVQELSEIPRHGMPRTLFQFPDMPEPYGSNSEEPSSMQ